MASSKEDCLTDIFIGQEWIFPDDVADVFTTGESLQHKLHADVATGDARLSTQDVCRADDPVKNFRFIIDQSVVD